MTRRATRKLYNPGFAGVVFVLRVCAVSVNCSGFQSYSTVWDPYVSRTGVARLGATMPRFFPRENECSIKKLNLYRDLFPTCLYCTNYYYNFLRRNSVPPEATTLV